MINKQLLKQINQSFGSLTVRTFGINLSRTFIIASLVLFIFTGCNSVNAPSFAGTVLSQAPEATDFTLLDQFGETITLADYKNQVVVLTFVYTACNDICPLIAHRLKEAEKYLIDAADENGRQNYASTTTSTNPCAHQHSYWMRIALGCLGK